MKSIAIVFVQLLFVGLCYAQNSIYLTKNISCHNGKDGELTVITNFGTPPYSFLWNNGATTRSIAGLSYGTYSVDVTDNLGNNQSFSYELENPTPISTNFLITANSDWRNPNGSIEIIANGGTGWFNFEVVDSISLNIKTNESDVFTNLLSGKYFITTTDINGCYKKDTVNVGELSAISTNFNIDHTACFNSTATIEIRPRLSANNLPTQILFPEENINIVGIIPGARPYITSNADTLGQITYNAHPGRNMFKIITNDGFGFRYAWTVLKPKTQISISFRKNDIMCYGDSTGEIHAFAQGGYEDFRYNIKGPSNFSTNNANARNLPAGIYTITTTDSTGCMLTQDVTILQPNERMRVRFGTNNTYCPESEDGIAWVNYVDNANLPISYLWDNGSDQREVSGLSIGWHSVQITDINNCIVIDSVEIMGGTGICIPNVITPNNDGENDVWDVRHMSNGSDIEVRIIDKYGNTVFYSTDNPIWDGKDMTNKLLPSGSIVFAYIKQTKPNGVVNVFRKTITILY